jgi:hypothetical protein
LIHSEVSERSDTAWSVRRVGLAEANQRGCFAENVEGERIMRTPRGSAVVTPLGGAHALITTLDSTSGVVTSGTFGRVVGHARGGEQRVDVHLSPGEPTTFSLAHNQVFLGDTASVGFGADRVLVRTALLTAERRAREVEIGLVHEAAVRAVHDPAAGTVRASVTGGQVVVGRVGECATELTVADDVTVRVTGEGRAEARPATSRTTFTLDPDAARVRLVCDDGAADVGAAIGVTITCERTGWRVSADEQVLCVESVEPGSGLRWDRATGTATFSGDLRRGGLVTRWSDSGLEAVLGEGFTVSAREDVRIHWFGKDFAVSRGRVVVADDDEDWYVTANGRLATAGSVVSVCRTIGAVVEATVRSAEHDWVASAWARGALIDGGGLRTALDDEGGVVCSPAARADCSVVSRHHGDIVVRAVEVEVEIASCGTARLRKSGTPELRVRPGVTGCALSSTITCGERFAIAVTDSWSDGFAWTITHEGSEISHSVRACGELVVCNSPHGAGITATVDEVRVVPPGGHTGHVITA